MSLMIAMCSAIVLAPALANQDAMLNHAIRSGEQVHWVPGEVQRLMRSIGTDIGDAAEAAELAQVLHSECVKLSVDPLYAIALMKVESSFHAGVTSSRGAVGLMQVSSAATRSVRVAPEPALDAHALEDPRTNVAVGLRYLQSLEREFDDRATALAAYNTGPTHIRRTLAHRQPLPHAYSDRVLATYATLRHPVGG